MKKTLLIFIKNPRPGAVKTRLARTLGDEEALRIYFFLLEKTRCATLGVAARRWLFYSDEIQRRDGWLAADFFKKTQTGDDLGDRMENAFRAAFEAGTDRAVIVGSDCPELRAEVVEAAFAALADSDFVLGPTPDGGYYLLGMRGFCPEVFRGVAWSTASVFSKTLEIIEKMGKTAATLPSLADVDTEEDWKGYLSRSGVSDI